MHGANFLVTNPTPPVIGYREVISTYEKKILMMPLDGDLLHLYYNKEVLSKFSSLFTWTHSAVIDSVRCQGFPVLQSQANLPSHPFNYV